MHPRSALGGRRVSGRWPSLDSDAGLKQSRCATGMNMLGGIPAVDLPSDTRPLIPILNTPGTVDAVEWPIRPAQGHDEA